LQNTINISKNNIKNSGLPILGQLLSLFPRKIFKETVSEFQTDRYYKKLKTWDHFVFMLYGVLTGSGSLREIISNFVMFNDKLAHCGVFGIPARSTISDANRDRDANFFGAFYLKLYLHFKPILSDSYLPGKINGEVDTKTVEIFDSTTVSLFNDIFKNTGRMPLNGQKKGGIKAFTKITLAERVPNYICLKSAVTNEKLFLSGLNLAKGTVAVFDKGFQKFSQYREWTENGVFFVTRMNKNCIYKVLNQRSLEHSIEEGVHIDSDIELTYTDKNKQKQTTIVRMVAYIDPETKKKLVFISNMFDLKADTICLLYKNRWTIEPLFKQIKQNFELTYFLSDSENGIKIQIWIALILNLLFTVVHKMIKEAEDFSTLVRVAAKNASSYVSLVGFFENIKDFVREIKRNLGKIQLDLFPENTPPSINQTIQNTS
jgi:hypothetical protein